jgi:uncharacterized protein YndB with AHSA1/START domain
VLVFESAADIAAAPEAVWAVLADPGSWPEWDSGVARVEGRAEKGSKLKLTTEADPGKAWPLKVAEVDPPRRLVFTGGMPLGLFKGERTYVLEPGGAGTRFRVREQFTGPLAPLIGRSIPDLQPAFDQFAAGLKARTEGSP